MGFEIVEQLGWRYPRHLVSPVAGGTLLPRIVRGLKELRTIGLVSGELPRVYAAQAAGCAPSRPASSIRSRSAPTRLRSRSRLAIRPTAIRSSRAFAPLEARVPRCPM